MDFEDKRGMREYISFPNFLFLFLHDGKQFICTSVSFRRWNIVQVEKVKNITLTRERNIYLILILILILILVIVIVLLLLVTFYYSKFIETVPLIHRMSPHGDIEICTSREIQECKRIPGGFDKE